MQNLMFTTVIYKSKLMSKQAQNFSLHDSYKMALSEAKKINPDKGRGEGEGGQKLPPPPQFLAYIS